MLRKPSPWAAWLPLVVVLALVLAGCGHSY
jgi:hypothetical protein